MMTQVSTLWCAVTLPLVLLVLVLNRRRVRLAYLVTKVCVQERLRNRKRSPPPVGYDSSDDEEAPPKRD